jgi:leucyl aminopeptidase (aminopeptidase T)
MRRNTFFKRLVLLLVLVTVVWACQAPKEPTLPDKLDWNAISDKMVERIQLQPGERVFMLGQPGKFDTLISLLESKIKSNKATYLGTVSIDSVQPSRWQNDFTQSVSQADSAGLIRIFNDVDLAIMLPGAVPTHRPYAAMQTVLRSGKARTIHFHWIGAYDKNGKAIEVNDSVEMFYQKALLETDYDALGKLQQKFEASAQNQWIEVTTPEGTALRFQITGRPVTKQDGDASLQRSKKGITLIDREVELPAGAIRVAPLEETVEGKIAFPPSEWAGQKVSGLVITFAKGKITSIVATEGEEAVKKEIEMGGVAAQSFRELAVGFNSALLPKNGHTWIPYFGYGAGVVRLSLGDNSELNGNVKGNYVRWNFFTNATVTVGSDVWIKEGKLIITK